MKYDELLPDQKLDVIRLQRTLEHNLDFASYSEKQLYHLKRVLEKTRENLISEYVAKAKRTEWRQQRSTKVLRDIERTMLPLSDLTKDEIGSLAVSSLKTNLDAYNKILSFDGKVKNFNNVQLSKTQLKSFVTISVGGRHLNDWVSRTFDHGRCIPFMKLSQEVGTSYVSGESYKVLVDRLSGIYTDITNDQLITLARSYVQEANVKAMETVYQKNRHIVKGVKWCATLEAGFSKSGRGTCARCAALDGNIYDLPDDEPFKESKQAPIKTRKTKTAPKPIQTDAQKLSSSINTYVDKIKNLPIERGIALNDAGEMFFSKIGTANHIDFNSRELDLLYNTTFLHNHPGVGSSFSPADFKVQCSAGIKTMYVVGKKGKYRMDLTDKFRSYLDPSKSFVRDSATKLTPMGKLQFEKIRDFHHDEYKKLFNKWNNLILQGKLTADTANTYAHHAIWLKVAKKYPDLIKYGVEKW